jgi:Rieske Fe-S protein
MGVTNDDTGERRLADPAQVPAHDTTRRAMLAGAAAAGVAVTLTACGTEPATTPTAGPPPTTGGAAATTGSGGGTGGSGGTGAIKTADIPVNGGKIFKETNTVVTQPKAGTFKAFTATCTHQGCPVASVSNGTINCNCHGSQYSAADGSVKKGPATKGLTPKTATVSGDSITVS